MYLPHKSFRPIWDTVLILLAFGLGFVVNDLFEVMVGHPAESSLQDRKLGVDATQRPTEIDGQEEFDKPSIDELLELERWGDVLMLCEDVTTAGCRNVHLRIMRQGLESADFNGARSIAKWFKNRRDSFGARPGSIIVLPEDAREVLKYCAVARHVDANACEGLEGTIAVGLLDNGEVLTMQEAHRIIKSEGLSASARDLGPNYVAKAEKFARSQRYWKAIRTCEKGLGHQRFACGWRISAWKRMVES